MLNELNGTAPVCGLASRADSGLGGGSGRVLRSSVVKSAQR